MEKLEAFEKKERILTAEIAIFFVIGLDKDYLPNGRLVSIP